MTTGLRKDVVSAVATPAGAKGATLSEDEYDDYETYDSEEEESDLAWRSKEEWWKDPLSQFDDVGEEGEEDGGAAEISDPVIEMDDAVDEYEGAEEEEEFEQIEEEEKDEKGEEDAVETNGRGIERLFAGEKEVDDLSAGTTDDFGGSSERTPDGISSLFAEESKSPSPQRKKGAAKIKPLPQEESILPWKRKKWPATVIKDPPREEEFVLPWQRKKGAAAIKEPPPRRESMLPWQRKKGAAVAMTATPTKKSRPRTERSTRGMVSPSGATAMPAAALGVLSKYFASSPPALKLAGLVAVAQYFVRNYALKGLLKSSAITKSEGADDKAADAVADPRAGGGVFPGASPGEEEEEEDDIERLHQLGYRTASRGRAVPPEELETEEQQSPRGGADGSEEWEGELPKKRMFGGIVSLWTRVTRRVSSPVAVELGSAKERMALAGRLSGLEQPRRVSKRQLLDEVQALRAEAESAEYERDNMEHEYDKANQKVRAILKRDVCYGFWGIGINGTLGSSVSFRDIVLIS